MKLQSYIEALLDQWTRGLLDSGDAVRQIREAVIEECQIQAQEKAEVNDIDDPKIIVAGNLSDGFRFIGPFEDWEEMQSHAEDNRIDEYWGASLALPKGTS